MGSTTGLPPRDDEDREENDREEPLGEFVAGRFAEVSIDSVEAVRQLREEK